MSTRPDLITGTSSEVLATVRIVTCRPWAAKIPRSLARYRLQQVENLMLQFGELKKPVDVTSLLTP